MLAKDGESQNSGLGHTLSPEQRAAFIYGSLIPSPSNNPSADSNYPDGCPHCVAGDISPIVILYLLAPALGLSGPYSVTNPVKFALSMVCDLPLWCAGRTSTFGPTHIHSRCRPGSFSAKVYIRLAHPGPGVVKRVTFTEQAITSKTELKNALGLAGQEARLAGDGANPLKCALLPAALTSSTYESRKADGFADRSRDLGGPKLCENIVQLVVSGPDQPDLSIVDLPGLVTGEGEGISRNLANTYVKKPESLVLLCLAAGGRDPATDTTEVRIVLNHDKDLKRCMNNIGDPTESAWGDIIVGTDGSFALSPAHGVHPVRCRTADEYRQGISGQEVIARGDALFAQEPWRELAAQAGRKFGWVETSRLLSCAYKKLVKNNVPKLRLRIQESTTQVSVEEAALPPAVDHPVDDLHTTIERIAKALEEQTTEDGYVTQLFLDLQVEFERELVNSVASFIPVLEKDSPPIPEGEVGGRPIYLDEFQKLFAKHRNARSSVVLHAARAALIRGVVSRWGSRCHTYNKAYWAALDTLIENVVAEECEDREEIATIVCHALHNLSLPLQEDITKFIDGRVGAEQSRREHVDTHDATPKDELVRVYDQYLQQFLAAYPAQEPQVLDRLQVDGAYFPPPNMPPNQWNERYVTTVIHFMAVVQWHLQKSIERIANTVGRELPVVVMNKFHPRVTATLREALRLNIVRDDVRKRVISLCEPDEEIVARREAVKKRRMALQELQWVSGLVQADGRSVVDASHV
ncbi:hypothetical protein CspHIS471_0605370 [Cutaneotrichosporon sp. HIS471]|nr:hypothetical protein CspHIS471_0605370 [Cutaneotrichosporon sp. HIS471]